MKHIVLKSLTLILVGALSIVLPSCGGSSNPTPSLQTVREALVASVGEEAAFEAVVRAMARGYSLQQIVDGALAGRVAVNGEISDGAGGTETPAGEFLGEVSPTRDFQINLEARVIVIQDEFFEQLGIEFELKKEEVPLVLNQEGYSATQIFDIQNTQSFLRRGAGDTPIEIATKTLESLIPDLQVQNAVNILSDPRIVPESSNDTDSAVDDSSDDSTNTSGTVSFTATPLELIFEHLKQRTKCPQPLPPIRINNLSIDPVQIIARSTDTAIQLKDGSTFVIGGLQSRELQSEFTCTKGIPFSSKIPLIGRLFKNNQASGPETELVVIVTANIVEQQEQ